MIGGMYTKNLSLHKIFTNLIFAVPPINPLVDHHLMPCSLVILGIILSLEKFTPTATSVN